MANILTSNMFETETKLFLHTSTVFIQDIFHKHWALEIHKILKQTENVYPIINTNPHLELWILWCFNLELLPNSSLKNEQLLSHQKRCACLALIGSPITSLFYDPTWCSQEKVLSLGVVAVDLTQSSAQEEKPYSQAMKTISCNCLT